MTIKSLQILLLFFTLISKWITIVLITVCEDMTDETLIKGTFSFIFFFKLGKVVGENFFKKDILKLLCVEIILFELKVTRVEGFG